jgi:hypothetical protein
MPTKRKKTDRVRNLPSKKLSVKDAKGVKGGVRVNIGTGMSKGFYNWISDSDSSKKG